MNSPDKPAEKNGQKMNDYHFWLSQGICPHCHKRMLVPGKHSCSVCLEKSRKRSAKHRKKALEAQNANSDNPSAHKTPDVQVKAVRAYRERHKAMGLCIYCSRKAIPGIQLCEKHRKQTAIWNNRSKYHQRHRPPRPHLSPPVPLHQTRVDLGELFALYNAGWKISDIAIELKASEGTVYKWLARAKEEENVK